MTPQEALFWQKVQRRAGSLTPGLASAMLLAYAALRDGLSEEAIVRAVQLGLADRVIEQVLTEAVRMAAYQPLRERLRAGIVEGVRYYGRTIPIPPELARTVTISFDTLNPRVIDAVRSLETRVITALDTAIVDTVTAYVENGLRDGVNPRTVARSLRSVIGLGPTQLQEVENFRDALLGQNGRSVKDYTLRAKRYDRLAANGEITPEQVEKAVELYRKRRIAQNAEVQARTVALDAQKLAQRLSFEDAIEKGIMDRDRLRRRWVGVMDSREREEHVAMEGQTVGFDEPFSNGEMEPGSSTYNCRCLVRYTQSAA